jgi:hypothetical protein
MSRPAENCGRRQTADSGKWHEMARSGKRREPAGRKRRAVAPAQRNRAAVRALRNWATAFAGGSHSPREIGHRAWIETLGIKRIKAYINSRNREIAKLKY